VQGSDDTFLRSCHKHFANTPRYVRPKALHSASFGIVHYSAVVEYSTAGCAAHRGA
jgi:hypothetical protein